MLVSRAARAPNRDLKINVRVNERVARRRIYFELDARRCSTRQVERGSLFRENRWSSACFIRRLSRDFDDPHSLEVLCIIQTLSHTNRIVSKLAFGRRPQRRSDFLPPAAEIANWRPSANVNINANKPYRARCRPDNPLLSSWEKRRRKVPRVVSLLLFFEIWKDFITVCAPGSFKEQKSASIRGPRISLCSSLGIKLAETMIPTVYTNPRCIKRPLEI